MQTRRHRAIFAAVSLAALAIAAALLFWPPAVRAPAEHTPVPSSVPADVRLRVDRWLAAKGLNAYGDPMPTRYPGGNPLFDSRTGRSRDRYEYILEKHPELREAE